MEDIQSLNSDTYVFTPSDSSGGVQFDKSYGNAVIHTIIYNGSTKDVFMINGIDSQPTAVFPTSASSPLRGKVIPPGAIVSYKIAPQTRYVSGIHAVAGGTGNVYVSVGAGV